MLAALVILGVLNGTMNGVFVMQSSMQRRERREWAAERRQLVDRVVARHTGEVIALDRTEKLQPREPTPERLIEGLS